jgi:hypothetical protein
VKRVGDIDSIDMTDRWPPSVRPSSGKTGEKTVVSNRTQKIENESANHAAFLFSLKEFNEKNSTHPHVVFKSPHDL